MSELSTQYYSSLGPFLELFRTGVPILTGHKLGPRPRGTRRKGLYLSERLFARQLRELHEAGFIGASLNDCATTPDNRAAQVVLTFDDGYQNVLTYGLEPLRQSGFRAIQFLVADRLGHSNEWDLPAGEVKEHLMDAAQVREWLAAGHTIGSHTLTHPYLTRLLPRQAREEIAASKQKLEDLFGVAVEHFCYPYGDWNATVRDLVRDAGYRTASTTDFGVNTHATSPFELKRITARYPSRNWQTLGAWLARNVFRRSPEREA